MAVTTPLKQREDRRGRVNRKRGARRCVLIKKCRVSLCVVCVSLCRRRLWPGCSGHRCVAELRTGGGRGEGEGVPVTQVSTMSSQHSAPMPHCAGSLALFLRLYYHSTGSSHRWCRAARPSGWRRRAATVQPPPCAVP